MTQSIMQFIETENQNADVYLSNAVVCVDNSDYTAAISNLDEALKIYRDNNLLSGISIALSWKALCVYLLKTLSFDETMLLVEEAKFLALKSSFSEALLNNSFVSGIICFYENNFLESLNLLKIVSSQSNNEFLKEKADIVMRKIDAVESHSIEYVQQKLSNDNLRSQLVSLLKLGRLISAETNIDALIEAIAWETSSALNADRCTVFMYDKENNELWSKVATGMGTEEIRFPADKGLAGHVAMTGNTVNIQDAYNDDRFNKEIDNKTGYVTKTILCMPIRNIKHEIVGVFQVLNKQNGVFTSEDEDILVALGSSAGIALENTRLFNRQQKLLEEQKKLFDSFIDTLAASIDARDKITSGHSSRVRTYSQLMCDVLGLSDKDKEEIKHAATLHDIGKIGVRDSVLQKEGKLTDDEYAHIQQHALLTHEILSRIYFSDDYSKVADIAASHHEKFDGNGYFMKKSGADIPLGGRILAVADVFDAITSKRHYRDKMPIKDAISILQKGAGSHFDPDMIDAFLSISCDKMVDIFLTEYGALLKDEHRAILKSYTMKNLMDILCSENISEEQRIFVDLFNTYYTNKSQGM